MSHSLTLVCDKIGSRHQFGPNGGVFGRSRKCDWVLPDQDRHLSSVHARILFQNETFVLVDESTNGTFLEGHSAAIGRGKAVSLSPGMTLQAGPYQLRVESIRTDPSGQQNTFGTNADSGRRQSQPDATPLHLDTLGASRPQTPSLDPLDHLGGAPSEPLAPVASVQTDAATIPEPVAYSVPTRPTQAASPGDVTRIHPVQPAQQGAQNPGADQTRFSSAQMQPDLSSLLPEAPVSAPIPAQAQSAPATPQAVQVAEPPSIQPVELPAENTASQSASSASSTGNIIPEDFLSGIAGGSTAPPAPAPSAPPAAVSNPQIPANALPVDVSPDEGQSSAKPSESVIPDGADFGFDPPETTTPVPDVPLPPTPAAVVPEPSRASAPVSSATLNPLEALKKRRALREAELAQKAKARTAPHTHVPEVGVTPGPSETPAGLPSAASKDGGSKSMAPPAQSGATTGQPATRTEETAVFQALLSGLGFKDVSVTEEDQSVVARETGEMVRELANGLIALLSARKSLKSEFRMYETRIQPEENNPFKHFNVGELAIDEMLFSRKGGFLPPAEAAKEAFKDLQSQNMITIAATQRAMRLLFESLSPETLAGEEDESGLRLKGLGSRRGKWEAAKERHERLRADFDAIVRQTIAEAFVQIEEEQARQQSQDFWGTRK
ncbi:type VI secretion system-associated FHA domain protein TagH [uncultured Roseibium sp.]|uniref:type VI secretion system-associated FHA domain protein TagH n=1 Tax=uncultured Roseibium sp. TaxID=1936171 RepID=UPI00260F3AEB|nr:type VI secretion system-associated FHA domain protein TagH [uncultured Roseibium sp.]